MFLELIIGAATYASWKVFRTPSDAGDADRERMPTPEADAVAKLVPVSWLDAELVSFRDTAAELQDGVGHGVEILAQRLRRLLQKRSPESNASRRAQLNALVGSGQFTEVSDEERQLRRDIVASGVTFGITLLGTFVAPALMPLAIAAVWLRMVKHLEGSLKDLRTNRRLGLQTLDALTSISIFGLGKFLLFATFSGSISVLMLVIHRTKDHSRNDLSRLIRGERKTVFVESNGIEVEVPFDKIKPDDRIILRAGEYVPADGQVVSGFASIDQHTLTGEARPVEKTSGDPVYAGTFTLTGRIVVQVQHAGEDTISSKVHRVLLQTADYRSQLEARAERIAEASVLPTFLLAGLALWWLSPASAVAVIVCSIGYQMRFTGPLTLLNYLRRSAHQGLLVKDGRALERIKDVDIVVFDKTGTLTQKIPVVANIQTFGEYTEQEVLQYAAAVEHRQSHPIAQAILAEAQRQLHTVWTTDEPACEVGFGVKAVVNGRRVRLGSERFVQQEGIAVPDAAREAVAEGRNEGRSRVWLAIDDSIAGVVELAASIRPEVRKAIQDLKARGLRLRIMSGDEEASTRLLAEELGISEYVAEVLPADKSSQIKLLQEQGHCVCFVGDGVNDAIALKTANVSVSLRGATTLALDTAQIILSDDNVGAISELFKVSDELDTAMKVNYAASTIPGVLNIAFVFLLYTGPAVAAGLAMTGLLIGAANSVRPALRDTPTPASKQSGS